ncbi:uncharacterized protein si:dkeyp-50b9.1 [Clupea harengus]|uniref:Uncharacterized protein si:dkeyp-50b9.1 n=1 Tax=Clupea harengus TaxID=7950 RepID=A0A6P8F879_CLUHA|nr:uncharacterized protein si:dkeyp-50b9.1 [Clupea harengus]
MDGCVVRLHTLAFKPKVDGSRDVFTAQPIIVHFHELLESCNPSELLAQVDNKDVLRAVVALYDVSLPDIGASDILDTVQCSGAHTIVLLRPSKDVLEEYQRRRAFSGQRREGSVCALSSCAGEDSEPHFSSCFSDSEESTEESSVDQEDTAGALGSVWQRFCRGLEEFQALAQQRRALRRAARGEQLLPPSAVGVESLIVGVATYELKTLTTGDKVLQLSLIAIRKSYRSCGVGRYLIELLKSQSVCGSYDALLAHADTDALNFFTCCGLIDDALLNDKFKEVRDEWTNTTLLSYLPAFTTESETRNPGFSLSLSELELEVDMTRMKALAAYQQQAVCVTRLVREVKTLREQLELQRREKDNLNYELELERERRHKIERMFLEYKLRKARQLLENPSHSDDGEASLSDPPSPADLRELLKEHERQQDVNKNKELQNS